MVYMGSFDEKSPFGFELNLKHMNSKLRFRIKFNCSTSFYRRKICCIYRVNCLGTD